MKTALIITTYNRKAIFEKCWQSVWYGLKEKPERYILVDDCSEFSERKFIYAPVGDDELTLIYKEERKGIKDSLLIGFNEAFKNCDLAINLDGDAIVKPDFITRLKDLKTRFPDRIISGFNCNHPNNPVLFDGGDYVERKHANGINMCINRNDYETIIRPALLSQNSNWDFSSTHDKNFIIAKPSVVDHLGWNQSSMGHGLSGDGDQACDF